MYMFKCEICHEFFNTEKRLAIDDWLCDTCRKKYRPNKIEDMFDLHGLQNIFNFGKV